MSRKKSGAKKFSSPSEAANLDIRNLFQKAGGNSADYREIRQEHAVGTATGSWPIVQAIRHASDAATSSGSGTEISSEPLLSSALAKPERVSTRRMVSEAIEGSLLETAGQVRLGASTTQEVAVESERSLQEVLNAIARLEATPSQRPVEQAVVTPSLAVNQPSSDEVLSSIFLRLSAPLKPESQSVTDLGDRSRLTRIK